MKKINVQYIERLQELTDESLYETMTALEAHRIGCMNWAEYPYCPSVHFKTAYSDTAMVLLFEVEENNVKAVAMENNGKVWQDSCVEFFAMCNDGKHYINFEMNCIGTILAARRTSRHDPEHLSDDALAQIRRITSLPHEPICRTDSGIRWWAMEVIPFALLGYTSPPPSLRANLYKCGDKCDQPHYLSWSPIALPKPDFHCPGFFGEINFKNP